VVAVHFGSTSYGILPEGILSERVKMIEAAIFRAFPKMKEATN
jgi:hypothetical protein